MRARRQWVRWWLALTMAALGAALPPHGPGLTLQYLSHGPVPVARPPLRLRVAPVLYPNAVPLASPLTVWDEVPLPPSPYLAAAGRVYGVSARLPTVAAWYRKRLARAGGRLTVVGPVVHGGRVTLLAEPAAWRRLPDPVDVTYTLSAAGRRTRVAVWVTCVLVPARPPASRIPGAQAVTGVAAGAGPVRRIDLRRRPWVARLVAALNALNHVSPDPGAVCPLGGTTVRLTVRGTDGSASRVVWNACGVTVRGVPLEGSPAVSRLMEWLVRHPRG